MSLETWPRYWQKGRVKRRQNSLHVYPCLKFNSPRCCLNKLWIPISRLFSSCQVSLVVCMACSTASEIFVCSSCNHFTSAIATAASIALLRTDSSSFFQRALSWASEVCNRLSFKILDEKQKWKQLVILGAIKEDLVVNSSLSLYVR